MSRQQTPQIYAHRGARMVAPENTLPAFERALAMGVDGIELDVHLSSDGQLVVIHDFTLEKTTNGHGLVTRQTAAELARLDAGSHFSPEYSHVGVPTLNQVFDLVGNRCRVNVEIKSEEPDGGPAADALVALLRARRLHDQVIVSSFNPITLIKLRWLEPTLALGLLYEEPLPPHLQQAWLSPILQPQALHPWSPLVTEPFMAWARALGLAVNVWTVNDLPEARRLAALGVDVIMSDVPDLLMQDLRS